MKEYEAIIIFRANLEDEKVTSLIARFEKKISDNGGEFEKAEKMGQKRLPFRMQKHKAEKEGLYYLLKFKGEGTAANALRDDFRIQENLLRHMVAVVPEVREMEIEGAEIAGEPASAEIPAAPEEISGQPQ